MKTGKQIFESLIMDKIDRTVTIESIVSSGEVQVTFTVCNTKWMADGQLFYLGELAWEIASVDIDTNTIIANFQADQEGLQRGDIITIQAPTFLSGTPRNLNEENHLKDNAGVDIVLPIVWLLEPIESTRYDKGEYYGGEFNFTFYCLQLFNGMDWLNDDRHEFCIYPMTQLMDAIHRVIEVSDDFDRDAEIKLTELSRFGREAQTGFTQYILDRNLSGLECQMTVKVERDACYC